MLKKSLFVMTVALLTVGAYGRDFVTPAGDTVDWEYDGNHSERKAESWNWPATYDFKDICVIPVRMDVGFWIKIVDCKDKKLDLKQVSIHKYSGSVDVSIQCNVNISLNAVWNKASGVDLGGYGKSVGVSPSNLDAPGGTVTISLTLTDVNLANLAGGTNCIQVGTVTLQVRPNVKPVLAGGCG
jgi:hypothetical protein